jgi:hypothetical protein
MAFIQNLGVTVMQEFFAAIADKVKSEPEDIQKSVFEFVDDFFNGKLNMDVLYKKDICGILECEEAKCDRVIEIMISCDMLYKGNTGYYPGSVINKTHV